MKRMRVVLILLIVTFAVACGQDAQTFDKVATFNAGFRFSPTGQIYTSLPEMGAVEWNSILYKPLAFPPIAHTHDYNTDLTNKPTQVSLQTALGELMVLPIPKRTTSEIASYTPSEGDIVFNKDLGMWMGFKNGTWITFITNK